MVQGIHSSAGLFIGMGRCLILNIIRSFDVFQELEVLAQGKSILLLK